MVNHRGSNDSYRSFIRDKSPLPTNSIGVVTSTCLGHFLNMLRIKFPFHLLNQLFYCYSCGSSFCTHDITLEFKVEDVAKILDLPMGPKPILITKKCGHMRYIFEMKYFAEKCVISSTIVSNKFGDLLKKAQEDDECIPDCVCTWIAYIFMTFRPLSLLLSFRGQTHLFSSTSSVWNLQKNSIGHSSLKMK